MGAIVSLFRKTTESEPAAPDPAPNLTPPLMRLVDDIGCLTRNVSGLGLQLAGEQRTPDEAELLVERLKGIGDQVEAACRAVGGLREQLAHPHAHEDGHE